MGDLTQLKADRETFKSAVAVAYPDKKSGAIPNSAGQIFRFVHEMKAGDLMIYPSKRDRQVHNTVPRTKFSQGALYEIGSAMSFFQVKNYADEFRAAAEGKVAPPQ